MSRFSEGVERGKGRRIKWRRKKKKGGWGGGHKIIGEEGGRKGRREGGRKERRKEGREGRQCRKAGN